MKTLFNINRKLASITGIVMGALVMTTTLANAAADSTMIDDKIFAAKIAALEAEVLAKMKDEDNYLAELKAFNKPMIKIFNENYELIYEGIVDNKEAIEDKQLLILIHKSDFLMSFENTSYYKLHN
ncbi:MAG: hypothetical protein MI921_11810 [Cytophagales bacterium]|nr:hypothetical protein [Cytophagales bacterium]